MRMWGVLVVLVGVGLCLSVQAEDAARGDGRSAVREAFLGWGFGMFLHFNMATYVDREWANGYEDPELFKPDKLDCGQWLDLARGCGMRC